MGRVEAWSAHVWSLTAGGESDGYAPFQRGLLPGSPSPAARSPPPATRECPRSTHFDRLRWGWLRWLGQSRHKCVDVLRAPQASRQGEGRYLDSRAADWFAVSFPSSQESNHRTKPSHLCTRSLYEFASLAYPEHTWSEDGQHLLAFRPGGRLCLSHSWQDKIQDRER